MKIRSSLSGTPLTAVSRSRSGASLRMGAIYLGAFVTAFVVALLFLEFMFPSGLRNSLRGTAIEAGYGYHGSTIRLRESLARLPGRLFRNAIDRPDIPVLRIDINFRNLNRLYERREEALDVGYLVRQDGDFVPASIRVEGRTVDVKLRLKGDMLDHVRTSKWSFRVHTRRGGHVFGMRRFSLQHPETRGFQAELLFLETLRRLGVLAPRYSFVKVIVNGNSVGLMGIEEHFSKELLESNQRRDGVIVRFDESLMWQDRVLRGRDAVRDVGPFDSVFNAPVTAFRSSAVMGSEVLRRQYLTAVGLLRGFIDGEIAASEVFDVDLLGKYLAAAELWGAWHGLGWNNQRFYLNPISMRLEPIGFDAHLEGSIGSGSINEPGTLAYRMLEDPSVYRAFEKTVKELKREVEEGSLIAYLEEFQNSALRQLRVEFPLLEPVDLSALRARTSELPYAASEPKEIGPFATHVVAYIIEDDGKYYLELQNPLSHDIEVIDITWQHETGEQTKFTPAMPLQFPISLRPSQADQKRESVFIEFAPLEAAADVQLRISARIAGQEEIKSISAITGALPLRDNPISGGSLATLLEQNPFLSLSEDGREVIVKPGRWEVRGSILMPPKIGLRVPAGTTLLFQQEGSLIVKGPTYMIGTDSQPVVLGPLPGTDERRWQGIVVLDAEERSVWKHVKVSRTSGVRRSSWELTGGVTFYRSDVTLSECEFSGNRAEDALNVIHADFVMEDVNFLDTASDAFDSDFSTGSIIGGRFLRIGSGPGADGVDVSGSDVTLQEAYFSGVSDKAISVGEQSRLTASRIVAEHCEIGAVSKDASTLSIRDSTIRNASLAGLMAYVKKSEYGPASLDAVNVNIIDTNVPAIVQHGSELQLDDRAIPSSALEVEALYKSAGRLESQ